VIFVPPSDGRLRPVHVLQSNLHDCVHLDAKPGLVLRVFHLGSEHMILFHISLLRVVPSRLGRLPVLVPLRFNRQARRQAGQLMAALL
jgi:hypothetical protein